MERTRKKRKIAVILICAAIMLAVIGVIVYNQEMKLREIRAERERLIARLEQLEDETAQLEFMIEYAKTDEYKLLFARDKLGLVGPEDILLQLREEMSED